MQDAAQERLRWHERTALWVWVAAFIVFGCLVEMRSAFLSRRMGDFNCFSRAAWAVRNGEDLYEIVEDNGWHYNYPPFLAIVLTPLADPPAGYDRTGYVPYAVQVGIWYGINLFFLFWGIHFLAGALQEKATDLELRHQLPYRRRWWGMRTWPLLICLVPICHSLMRGQLNCILLACLCFLVGNYIRGRKFRAGLHLAIAASLKVFPVFLLAYPLWKRDRRALAGALTGFMICLLAVPLAYWGPETTWASYQKYTQVFLGPALHLTQDDDSRQNELLGYAGSTDNQAIPSALNAMTNWDLATRPAALAPWMQWTHRGLALVLTLATLLVVRSARFPTPLALALQLGALMVVMVAICPVSHIHYSMFALPLVMALLTSRWEYRQDLCIPKSWLWILGVFVAAAILPHVEPLIFFRNWGLPTWASLMMWGAALREIHVRQHGALIPRPSRASDWNQAA